MTDAPSVFLSYSSADRGLVVPYFEHLKSAGFNVWMDTAIKGGQNWDFEIQQALKSASLIVCFFSKNSLGKRGYVQREIKLALDFASEKLESDIFLIPVILDDDVGIPDQISHIQAIRGAFTDNLRSLISSIHHQYKTLGYAFDIQDETSEFSCAPREFEENWDGAPGYAVRFDLIDLQSTQYPQVVEAATIVNGWLYESLHAERTVKFHQNLDDFDFADNPQLRINFWDASLTKTELTGTSLSVLYSVHWYGAGAAHPNHHFSSFCFSLNPMIHIRSLAEIFADPDKSLGSVQSLVRLFFTDVHERSEEFQKEWVESGTKDWTSLSAFAFRKDGVEILFAPYEINCYAAGSHSMTIPYGLIVDEMDHNFQHILGIAYVDRIPRDKAKDFLIAEF